MLTLVRGYILIDIAEFTLDDPEAFVDEVGCAYRDLVAVVNPVLVVNAYDSVDQVFGPLD